MVGHFRGGRALFGGVGERAEAVELGFGQEIKQFLELLFRLAGEADDNRRAQGDAALVRALDSAANIGACAAAVHPFQHRVVDVLNRQINIAANIGRVCDDVQQLLAGFLRIAVEDAQPVHAVDFRRLLHQLRQLRSAAEVHAVARRVLRNEDVLLHALLGQTFDFAEDVGFGAGAVRAADFRNRAERAAVRAALADAGVRGVGRGGQHAVVGVVGVVVHAVGLAHAAKRLFQRVGQLLILVDAHQQVDFRNLLHQILLVALGKAARDHQRTALADLLVPRHVENRVDGLLLRRRDEPAGVHHQHIRLRGIVRQLIPVLPQQPQRGLAIHAVLITSQRNHSNLEFRHCFLLTVDGGNPRGFAP